MSKYRVEVPRISTMRWYWIFIVALMSTLVTGCGSGDTASDVTELDEDETSSQLVDGPAADVELSVVSEVEKFTPPFPMNSSFFSQPEVEKAVVTPNSFNVADGEHANVRVIGFTQIGDGETQALISIRGSLRSVRTGDSIDGVSVVAIDAPRLTLQQRNERWTVALFNQPLVNQYASASKFRNRTVKRGRRRVRGDTEFSSRGLPRLQWSNSGPGLSEQSSSNAGFTSDRRLCNGD
jgi:hypothetical protein